jgi:hypothetical protein
MLGHMLRAAGNIIQNTSTKKLSYIGNVLDNVSATSYTFTGASIGTAAADRVIVVGVMLNSGSARTVSSVTLGGNAMTSIVGTNSASNTALFRIDVASGTTANIVVTGSGASNGCFVVIYSLIGWGTVTTYNSNSATGSGSTISTTIDTVSGGAVIGIQNRFNTDSITTAGFTTQDTNGVFDITQRVYSGNTFPTTAATGTTYSVTGTAATSSIAVASFNKSMQYISVSTYSAVSTSTTHNVPAPTVYNAGDLIVMFIASGSDQAQTLTDSGWTTVVNTYNATADNTMHVAYRTAESEPSTYGVTQATARGLVAACVVLRNAAYNTYATATSANSSGLAVSVTPFDAINDGIIYYSAASVGTDLSATPPTGYTEIAELYTGTTFSEVNLQIAYRVPNSSQSTTSVTNSWSASTNNQSSIFDFKNA